jgi:hypothetical protein
MTDMPSHEILIHENFIHLIYKMEGENNFILYAKKINNTYKCHY